MSPQDLILDCIRMQNHGHPLEEMLAKWQHPLKLARAHVKRSRSAHHLKRHAGIRPRKPSGQFPPKAPEDMSRKPYRFTRPQDSVKIRTERQQTGLNANVGWNAD
jgi:hypothetical protein